MRRSLEHGNDVYVCFLDFEKAFDRVNWVKVMETLMGLRIDWRDRRMIRHFYMNQNAVVRVGGGESEPGVIGRGVRTRMSTVPLLFSLNICRGDDDRNTGRKRRRGDGRGRTNPRC